MRDKKNENVAAELMPLLVGPRKGLLMDEFLVIFLALSHKSGAAR